MGRTRGEPNGIELTGPPLKDGLPLTARYLADMNHIHRDLASTHLFPGNAGRQPARPFYINVSRLYQPFSCV